MLRIPNPHGAHTTQANPKTAKREASWESILVLAE